jgi:alcohol dehydrogenase, propanol-preferring
VPWLGWTCGECRYCRSGRENLCDRARFTGYDVDGGYAELAAADERFCFPIPADYPDEQAAPLLCAGLIGYRALRLVGDAERIGFYGFGASAHILCQVAVHQGRRVFAFTRPGDEEGQAFARELGAEWVGSSEQMPPEEIDGAIVFAPVGSLMTTALRASAKGARIISAGIHMSDIPGFPYEQLWGERTLGSVANLTRLDGEEFIALAPQIPVRTEVEVRPLEEANEAIDSIRDGSLRGAAVLQNGPGVSGRDPPRGCGGGRRRQGHLQS